MLDEVEVTTSNQLGEAGASPKTRHARILEWLSLIGFALMTIDTIGHVLVYFQDRAWQILADIGLSTLTLLGLGIAYWLARRRRVKAAGYWILLTISITFAPTTLFLIGVTGYTAATGLLAIIIVAITLWPRKWTVWLATAGLYLAFALGISRLNLLTRYNISQSTTAFIVDLVASGSFVLLMLWLMVGTFRRVDTIRTRLLIAFVLVALLPIIFISLSAGIIGLESDRQQAFDRLGVVATLKEAEVKNWIRDSQAILANTLSTGDTLRHLYWLLQQGSFEPLRQEAYLRLQEHLERSISQSDRFEELFLMDRQGQVMVSTDPALEGEDYSHQIYFLEGLKGAYVQSPSYSSSPEPIPIIFTRPVVDNLGNIFVLAGQTSPMILDQTMTKGAGLGETLEIFLVDGNHVLLTRTSFGQQGMTTLTQGAIAAVESQTDGAAVYQNSRGRPVLGVYRWLPELQAALMVEQNQSEVYRKTYTTLTIMGGVALAAVLVAAAVSLVVTRSIANPLAKLADTAAQIAAGDLGRRAAVGREDEIGALGRAFNSMTGQLRELIGSLEERVAERTHDLERRAVQLQAAAEVGQAAASMHNLDELLSQVTHLISERFGFYHAGIFLVDEAGKYAVLRAANSQGGQRMLDRGHRLPVGEQGIVGYVTGTGQPRIALDVGADAVYFDNPDMPDTHSEMALPLMVGGHVLGALDVQSTEEATFTQEDIEVLQVVADQVAVAIENTRLFAETQEALEATRRAYGEVSRQAWTETLRAQPEFGFRSNEDGVTGAENIWRPEMEQALHQGQTIQLSDSKSQISNPLAVPIKVRGQVVGILDTYKPRDTGAWTPGEVALLEHLTEQLGVALESARLYQDVQRTAARERLTRQITDELRRATTPEEIVQTAVDALFDALGTSRAFGHLEATPPTQDRGTDEPQ